MCSPIKQIEEHLKTICSFDCRNFGYLSFKDFLINNYDHFNINNDILYWKNSREWKKQIFYWLSYMIYTTEYNIIHLLYDYHFFIGGGGGGGEGGGGGGGYGDEKKWKVNWYNW